ncbi:hypothetical protein D3C80_2069330 [compost metagenome]
MGAGIVTGNRAVETATDNRAILHQHRADRHLAQVGAQARLLQGFAHKVLIPRTVDNLWFSH